MRGILFVAVLLLLWAACLEVMRRWKTVRTSLGIRHRGWVPPLGELERAEARLVEEVAPLLPAGFARRVLGHALVDWTPRRVLREIDESSKAVAFGYSVGSLSLRADTQPNLRMHSSFDSEMYRAGLCELVWCLAPRRFLGAADPLLGRALMREVSSRRATLLFGP
jgi:hypothetical protein